MRAIITFYSYKGGVGRTMALANIAILLARRGLRVLMIDWDLEAPGLHRYFEGLNTVPSDGGLLDLLIEAGNLRKAPRWDKYLSTVTVDDSTTLTMLSAGRVNDDYDRRVLEFDWNRFFREQNGGEILESLRQEWISEFDAVLIDSRTGITDSGGVCTVQMPDILVPVLSPNYQNLEGTKDVVRKAQLARQTLAYDRTQLLVFPLLSRFDGRTEYNESQAWLKRSAEELKEFYVDWLPKEILPLQVLERTKIPYVAFFSFGEKLPVFTEGTSDPESIGFAYETAATLIANGFQDVAKVVAPQQIVSRSEEKISATTHPDWSAALARLKGFTDEIIADSNTQRFKILLETARAILVEMWESYQISGPGLPADIQKWNIEITDFYQNGFASALDAVVDIALQIVRYDASTDWVSSIVEVLIECFEASRRFDRLKSSAISSDPNSLHFARPAYVVYLASRAIATYAIARKRYRFLSAVLPRFVRLFTIDNNSTVFEPLLFWPFRGAAVASTDMRQGRNQSLWEDHIGAAWGHYFGSAEAFLNAAAQLEFVLEFNSYVFEGVQIPEVKRFQLSLMNKSFGYLPDFWTNRLDPTISLAEYFYDILREKPTLPSEFCIEKQAIELALKNKESRARLLFLGGYLAHLENWQEQAMLQQNRFPFMFDWPGRLKEIVDAFKRQKNNQSS